MTDRPPLPPFDQESALIKVQAAEDAWNTRDPKRVAGAYTVDSTWRNRDAFVTGRAAIIEFLTAKWNRELDYALRKNLWAFRENRIAVRSSTSPMTRMASGGVATATSSGSSTSTA
jgi:uncharacterized protein